MALETTKAFDEFKGRLALTNTQQILVMSRRTSAEKYLESSFGQSSNMPLKTTKLIGSAGRSTIIRPLDDVDVMAVFTNKDGVFETYRSSSQAFLYRVRDALSGYSVKIVGARGQAVRLFYKDGPYVDIAPVFKWKGSGYALPDGKGGWLTTDPDAHAAWMVKRNAESSNRLKPMVRMLKRWNAVHSKRLKSFHLEVLAASTFGNSPPSGDSRRACEVFFDYAKNHLRVNDPAGHSGDLSIYLTALQRLEAIASLESARSKAAAANAAERRGNHKEAIRLWRIIFGDEFPAYG